MRGPALVHTALFDLSGKVAIVTGGNGGIGLAMATGLGRAGARVVIAARDEEKSQAALARLQASSCDAVAVRTDVADPASVAALTAEVEARFGRIDVLVNNAGINVRRTAQELSLEDWRLVVDTNLTSAFLCVQAVYPAMRRAGGGKIINVGSLLSVFGASFAPAYGASKGGVVQLTKSLAVAWAVDGIQVNAVLPGWIDTDMSRAARRQIAGLEDRALDRTPAGRFGEPRDLEGIAVFLASRASDFITGAAIPVDGGYSVSL